MGGNVFPGHTRRYYAAEYHQLTSEVLDRLRPHVNRAVVIPAYSTKQSFGDMDILVIPKPNMNYGEIFNTQMVSANGGVHSLVYKQFQLDMIVSNADEFDYSLRYFSFNDRGNLIGKIAHKFGIKHGHKGLTMPIRNGDYLLGEITLTRNPRVADEFLGVEYVCEFDTLEQVFENVIGSKYFSKEIYAFENMNHTARIRDRKRTTYNAFLKYIADRDLPTYEFHKVKDEYHDFVFAAFPPARSEFQLLVDTRALVQRARIKFNGRLVSQLTGLVDKPLGSFMRKLSPQLSPQTVDQMTDDQIQEIILSEFDKYSKLV